MSIHLLTAKTHSPITATVCVWHPHHDARIFYITIRQCPIADDGALSGDPCIPLDAILDAGAIVTGNYSSAAILSKDREGTQPITSALLGHGNYYLIPNPDEPNHDYPVYKDFNQWKPPSRDQVPERWFTESVPRQMALCASVPGLVRTPTRSNVSCEAMILDRGCVLSGAGDAIESARIVPAAQAAWATHHRIAGQLLHPCAVPHELGPLGVVNDIRNFLTLRLDLRMLWDDHRWAFIPYTGSFMAYYPSWTHQPFDWHCFTANLHPRVDGYLLFLRFALVVFNGILSYNRGTFSDPEDALYIPPVSALGKRKRTGSSGRSVRRCLSHAEGDEEDGTTEGGSQSSGESENDRGSSGYPVDEDYPRRVAASFAEAGMFLPDDLAAVWAPIFDKDYDQQKCDWFAKNPQIRSIADPAQVSTSSSSFEGAVE
ncbi:hypothetical protein OE88DRAFT_1667006 [Heliocybe sulcata]|uniref:HNH nuclease domain-containing protein n=1 Tax=Heliocybe sulcata TaxID=5364 RepID=A0A5C3MZ60_9AGAM|nr:hypothetical protein OE88DRAFT_1667006 [Heliocybe sulcata]